MEKSVTRLRGSKMLSFSDVSLAPGLALRGGVGGCDPPPEPVSVGKLATSVGKMVNLP